MEMRERIQTAIRENPNQMTMLLARQFGVPEVEIIRAFPDERAIEPASLERELALLLLPEQRPILKWEPGITNTGSHS